MSQRQAIHVGRYRDDIVLVAITGQTRKRIYLTEEEAQHLSNRLQSYAKGNYGSELVIDKEIE